MRKVLIGLGVVVTLVVGAALVVPSVIDWNRFKGDIAAEARKATGRTLTIAGDLDMAILPSPRLSAHDVRLANVTGGSAPDMARLKSLDVRIRFWPLLEGRVEVDSVTLVEPSILLETLADGRANWDIAAPATGSAAPATGPAASAGRPPPAIRLDRLRIERGTVVWRDAASGAVERITDLTMNLAAGSLKGPFRADGSLTLRKVPLTLQAALGQLRPENAAALSLALKLPTADASANLSGSIALLADKPRFTGKLDVQGKNLARVLAALNGGALPAPLAQPFRLRASLTGSAAHGSIENLDAELGGVRASGKALVTLGDKVRTQASLRVTRLDLDALLKRKTPAGVAAPAAGRPAPPAATAGAAAGKPDFQLPATVDAAFDVGVDAVTFKGQSLRDISLKARITSGRLLLQRATALLPGGGDATLTGSLAGVQGRPTFDARLDAQSDNLRALLGWLDVDVGAVPSDRLRKVALSAGLRGNDQQVLIDRAQLSFDASRVDFAATVLLRDRPAFGATLNIGDINLDAYMPRKPRRAPASRSAARAAAPSAAAGAPAPSGLAALKAFDANLKLSVASLTVNRTAIRDIRFDGTLSHGVIDIRRASVANVGGARAQLSGRVSNLEGFPVFKGNVSADARDIGGLLRVAGITPPPAVRSLGALKLRGSADAKADKVKLDLSLDAAGGKASVKGVVSGLPLRPAIDGRVTVRHGNLAALIRTLGGDPGKARLGPFALALDAKGNLDRLSVTTQLDAAGGRLKAAGFASALVTKPVFQMTLDASHPAVGDLVRRFDPAYRPAGGKIGPLRVKASLNGANAAYNLAALSVSAGKVALNGSGKLRTDGARPALTASLTAGVIDLNPFLAPPHNAAGGSRAGAPPAPGGGKAAAPGGRFSNERIDTVPLGFIDADLAIGADALIYRRHRVDKPTIKATLANRLLTISEISGLMFDGKFDLKGKFDGRTVPALDGTVTISKANVGKALLETGSFDITGGITDFALNATARGRTPRAMVAALDGGGTLRSVNGVFKGFDLKAVSDRLKNLDRALDFLSLFGSAMGGGSTKFSELTGTFAIRNGVLRSNDLRLVADAGLGTAHGFADLPRWTMDFTSEFRLTEHPKAPPFGMRAVGPIDNPKRIFKFDALQTYLLQRGVGSLLRKVFPRARSGDTGGSGGTASPPAQPQPTRKPRIEDILPGLLRGLGR